MFTHWQYYRKYIYCYYWYRGKIEADLEAAALHFKKLLALFGQEAECRGWITMVWELSPGEHPVWTRQWEIWNCAVRCNIAYLWDMRRTRIMQSLTLQDERVISYDKQYRKLSWGQVIKELINCPNHQKVLTSFTRTVSVLCCEQKPHVFSE